jgi:hypothetical protein
MGVLPGIFLRPMEPSVVKLIDRVTGTQPSRVQSTPASARPAAAVPGSAPALAAAPAAAASRAAN